MSKVKMFSVLLAFFLLVSCVAKMQDVSTVTYAKVGFDRESLKTSGVAILPISAGEGIEGYRRPFGDAVNISLGTLGGEISCLKWQETIDLLNQHDLASRYQEAIIRYKDTSIIDKNLIIDMGRSLGVRYFLFIELQPFQNDSQLKPSLLSDGFYTQETKGVQAIGQLWDSEDGDVVWEGIGGAKAQSGELSYIKTHNPEEYSKMAADGLVRQLLGLRPAAAQKTKK